MCVMQMKDFTAKQFIQDTGEAAYYKRLVFVQIQPGIMAIACSLQWSR